MARLTLFGGVRIEGDQGPLPGRASQKRRLALLALLASPPARRIARDKLTAYLWPDADDERARRNLSSAVYDLKAELGEGAVVTSGDELALNLDVIQTDVDRFVTALEQGDLAAATAAYGGPFLDGFFLSGAEEFERWAEAERQGYVRDYQRALEHLARERAEAGDAQGTVDAWRELSVADPYSARVAIGYMRALEAVGDRAGALQFERVHTALLREEFGAAPDPDVTALAERLRQEPVAAASEAVDRATEAPAEPAKHPEPALATELAEGPEAGVARPAATSPARPVPEATARWKWSRALVASLRRVQRARMLTWSVAMFALGVAAFSILAWAVKVRTATDAVPVTSRIGVAVLPFQNLSGSPDMNPFSDGLTEEIITGLGRVEWLRIPARSTIVSHQRGAAPGADVGRDLGVRYLVEGTVRSEDARVRITANLVDAATGSVVWRDQYDLRMVSVFDAQEEIAQAVVSAVAPQLAGNVRPLVEPTTRDTAAYALYLKGRAHWYGRSPDDLRTALSYFEQALAQDPGYALAYAAIADVYGMLGAFDYGLAPPARTFPLAREAAERALELDPDLPEAHAALGNVLFNYDWDLPAAEARYRRAIRSHPGYGMARHWLSLLLTAAGRPDEALQEIYDALEMDPRSPVLTTSLARHLYYRGDFERALDEFDAAIAFDPSFILAYLGAGMALVQQEKYDLALARYEAAAAVIGRPHPATLALIAHAQGLSGRTDQAATTRRQLTALAEAGVYVPAHYLALAAIGMGDFDAAIQRLEDGLTERSAVLIYARLDPIVDPLRSDSRFDALLRQGVPRGAQR
jgi:TolB-like protein/DNA-binding SARP family transcriptional activator/Tfp pilus assembly protein PilF